MDNDDKIVGQIISRRQALGFSLSGLAVLAGARGAAAESPGVPLDEIDLVATPELTEGPFFIDNKLKRKNVLGDTKRESVKDGIPLKLKVTVYELKDGKGVALKNAQVDIWHADTIGSYSDESPSPIQREDTKGQTWLRGCQTTDAQGVVEFKTIYPGWYIGRTSHIHFKIRTYSASGNTTHEFTSQFFFDEKINDVVLKRVPYNSVSRPVRNEQDGIFAYRQADGTRVGSHLVLNMKEAKSGYDASFSVALVLTR